MNNEYMKEKYYMSIEEYKYSNIRKLTITKLKRLNSSLTDKIAGFIAETWFIDPVQLVFLQ